MTRKRTTCQKLIYQRLRSVDTWSTKSNYSEEVPFYDEVKCCYAVDDDVQAV